MTHDYSEDKLVQETTAGYFHDRTSQNWLGGATLTISGGKWRVGLSKRRLILDSSVCVDLQNQGIGAKINLCKNCTGCRGRQNTANGCLQLRCDHLVKGYTLFEKRLQ